NQRAALTGGPAYGSTAPRRSVCAPWTGTEPDPARGNEAKGGDRSKSQLESNSHTEQLRLAEQRRQQRPDRDQTHQKIKKENPMTQHTRNRFRPQLEVLEDRTCPSSTTVLPISAFLAQQGHASVFTPPARDQGTFSNSTFDPGTTSGDPNRIIV